MAKNRGKKVIIIGATSGLGAELTRLYLERGCTVGITGRREDILLKTHTANPQRIHFRRMDVQDVPQTLVALDELIAEMGGVDTVIYSAGVGTQNPPLESSIEMAGVYINVAGFTSVAVHAFNYFKTRGGQFVVLSSLAGIRSLRQSPAYSATKRYQMHYMECLAAKARKDKLPVRLTTLILGLIRTPILKYKYRFTISLERGARLIYNAIERGHRSTILPVRWRVVAAFWRILPTWLWVRI